MTGVTLRAKDQEPPKLDLMARRILERVNTLRTT
jgi:hypothetical protein